MKPRLVALCGLVLASLCVAQAEPVALQPFEPTAALVTSPPGATRCIAAQPNGSAVAASGDDTAIKVWSADGTLQSIGLGHQKSVRALAWSPDGKTLASRGSDDTIRLWNPTDGAQSNAFKAPSGLASALVWSRDGKTLIADGPAYGITVFDAATGKARRTWSGHRKWVNALALSPDGTKLASAGGDGDARIWDWQSGKCERILHLSDGQLRSGEWLQCLAWSADGKQLAAGGDSGQVRVWDARDGRLLQKLSLGAEVILALNWNDQKLSVASDKGNVFVCGLETNAPKPAPQWKLSVGWKPLAWNNEFLAARDEQGAVQFFDASGIAGQTLKADDQTPMLRAARWHREGLKLWGNGRYQDAIRVLQRAREWAPDGWQYAVSLSWALNSAQEFEDSRAVLQHEIARAPTGNVGSHARRELKRQLSYTHSHWGLFLSGKSEFSAALAQHETELQQAIHIGDARNANYACSRIAANHFWLEQPEKAISVRWRALAFARKTGVLIDEASALRNLGDSYLALDRYAEALRAFWQSHGIYGKAGSAREVAISTSQIGLIYYYLGDYSRALRFYRSGLTQIRPLFELKDEAAMMGNIALVYLAIDRPDMAAHEYRKALQVARRAKERSSESGKLAGLAGALARLKRFDEAKKLAREAVAIEEARGDRARKSVRLRNMALVLLDAGEPRAALEPLYESLWLAHRTHSSSGEANALGALMKACRDLKQPELAIYYGKRAVNLRQKIRSNLRSLDNDLQGSYARSKEADYRGLADLLIGRGRLSEAGEVLGLLKQQEFLGFVRRDASAATAGGQSDLGATETDVAGDEAALWQSVLLLSQEKSRLSDLDERSFAQTERLEKVNAELKGFQVRYSTFLAELPARFEARETPARDLKGEFAGMQGILSTLSKPVSKGGAGVKAAAIYTLVTPDRVRVIFVGPYGAPVPLAHEIKSDELNRKVFAFHDAIKNRAPVEKLARELYDVLFCDGQLEKQLRASGVQTLMWSLDGSLRYLPLGALHDGKGWLVERYAQSTFSAASVTRLEKAPSASWTALGLGVSSAQTVKLAPYEPESFAALPGVLSELRGIVRTSKSGWNGGALEGKVLTDSDFNFKSLKAGLKAEYPVLHIATHFRLRARNAESFLLMGNGEPLTLDKLPELSNGTDQPFGSVDLVAFSACQTALGGDTISRNTATGVEVDSLGTLAQEQGARAVLATLWPVADASTSTLMQTFYALHESNSKLSKTEALRRAQLALLRGEATGDAAQRGAPRLENSADDSKASGRWSHPYYWAPFTLIGNWR